MPQSGVAAHFAGLADGRLILSQSILSRMIQDRELLEAWALSNPNTLSSKRPRQVTHLGVEKASFAWVEHMETKGETVNGPMLVEKWARFEKLMNVPEEQWMKGDGWLSLFCKAYKIKEHCHHGEAGSVDLEAIEIEQARCRAINVAFNKDDIYNFDETAVFAFAPPDRGLATQQMSGKKKNKFHITLGFAVNTSGMDKLPIFFIGCSKQPQCMEKKSPKACGFYYWFNKKAWMTGELFEEWLKWLNRQMFSQKHHILLWIDNFSGHKTSYAPSNIQIKFFKPNMTSFVQPLDAGIIWCYKAHYCKAFCSCVIKMDKAGEPDIYKVNLLEAMLMMKESWAAVKDEMIAHCWEQTSIMHPNNVVPDALDAAAAPAAPPPLDAPIHMAWNIIREFATTKMSLPKAETHLQAHLRAAYTYAGWRAAFDTVMGAKNNEDAALAAVNLLAPTQMNTIKIPRKAGAKPTDSPSAQLVELEASLMISVDNLYARKCIHGLALTIDELLNSVEIDLIGEAPSFENDKEIMAAVEHAAVIAHGEIEDINEDTDKSDEEEGEGLSSRDVILLAEQLEWVCLKHGPDLELSVQLSVLLHTFRGQMWLEELRNAV